MYRRIVLYNITYISGPVELLYHVRGARLLFQYRASAKSYEDTVTNGNEMYAAVFPDSIRLRVNSALGYYRTYEFVLDVSENQPIGESVEERTSTGSAIVVYNENGVVVCSNGVKPPTNIDPAKTNGLGEMTSEPIGGTGEMTSEPIDGTGEMKSEPIDGLNTTI